MARNLLHKSKLEDFKLWLDANHILHRPGKGVWEVLQVKLTPNLWGFVFRRLHMPEHYTTSQTLERTVLKFIKDHHVNQTQPSSTARPAISSNIR